MKGTAAALVVAIGLGLFPVVPAVAQGADGRTVVAQVEQRDRTSIFRFLRREPKGVVVMDPPRGTTARPKAQRSRKVEERRPSTRSRTKAASRQKEPAKRARRTRAEAPARKAAPPPAAVAPVEKAADAQRILVVGDFMANAMAKGLADAYAESAGVMVVDATNGSSGLVRADHYNWPTEIHGFVAKEQPAAILVLIGSNDRQSLDSADGPVVLGSQGWPKAYAERVKAFAEALKGTGKPVLWGSLVPVRPAAMSRDYSAMNSIFREALDGTGITFVDLWNGFADEEGQFIASGPDIAGRNSRLRASDGINFTRAGQRKLAFFAQRSLDDILNTGAAPQVASLAPQDVVGPPVAAGEEAPRIGPMMPMEALLSAPAGLSSVSAADTDRGGAGPVVVERLADSVRRTPKLRADHYLSSPVY